MTADEKFMLIRTKVERAKEHIDDIKMAIVAFHDTKPYKIGIKNNPETRQLIYYISDLKPVPINIALIAGDALQNLRSALDHLAYELVVVGVGGPPPDPTRVGYPIARDAASYPSFRNGVVQGMRKSAINAIDATKPYRGGNDTLWRLHELNRIDKHRLLVTVGSAFHGVNLIEIIKDKIPGPLAEAFKTFPPIYLNPADKLCPLQVGDELYIDAPDSKVNEKMDFRFDVAFGEPGVIEGESVFKTLHDMADLVDNLITSFRPLLI